MCHCACKCVHLSCAVDEFLVYLNNGCYVDSTRRISSASSDSCRTLKSSTNTMQRLAGWAFEDITERFIMLAFPNCLCHLSVFVYIARTHHVTNWNLICVRFKLFYITKWSLKCPLLVESLGEVSNFHFVQKWDCWEKGCLFIYVGCLRQVAKCYFYNTKFLYKSYKETL